MAISPLKRAVERLRQTALVRAENGPSDGHLLETFVAARDESAFAALVRRHGPMVLGVCRRVVGNVHDAEDAFQATFLVLVRRAHAVVPREAVGNFLYGVAYRTALEARRQVLRRQARERQVTDMPHPQTPSLEPWSDMRPLIDRELSRLPDDVRLPVILCDLEGRTRRDVARHLNLPEGTLSNRLMTGRKLLARRLARCGVALSAGGLATVLDQQAMAAVPAMLLTTTIEAATHVAAGGAAAEVVSTQAAALFQGALRAMLTKKLTTIGALLLTAGMLAVLAGVSGSFAVGQAPEKPPAPAPQAKGKDNLTWQITNTLIGHKDRVDSVRFSPDGKLLASASKDGTVIMWEAATGKLLHTLKGHEGWVFQTVFSPDGKTVATAGQDKKALLWEVKTGKQVQQFAGLSHEVYSVAFSPDGKMLVTAGGFAPKKDETEKGGGEIALWDPATGKEIGTRIQEHTGRIAHLAFTPDGKTLITGAGDNQIKLWDVDGKGSLKVRNTVEGGGTQGLYGMALSPDGKKLAFVSNTGLKFYDLATDKLQDDVEQSDQGFPDAVAFAPDGKSVAMNLVVQDNENDKLVQKRSLVRIWDVETGKIKETAEVDEPSESLAFSPDGKTIAVGCRGRVSYPASGVLMVGDFEEGKDGPVKVLRLK